MRHLRQSGVLSAEIEIKTSFCTSSTRSPAPTSAHGGRAPKTVVFLSSLGLRTCLLGSLRARALRLRDGRPSRRRRPRGAEQTVTGAAKRWSRRLRAVHGAAPAPARSRNKPRADGDGIGLGVTDDDAARRGPSRESARRAVLTPAKDEACCRARSRSCQRYALVLWLLRWQLFECQDGRRGVGAPGSLEYQRMKSRSRVDRSVPWSAASSPKRTHRSSSIRIVCRGVPRPLLPVTSRRCHDAPGPIALHVS